MIIRMIDIVRYFPKRLLRLTRHIWSKGHALYMTPSHWFDLRSHSFWFIELFFLLLDLIGSGEVYEMLAEVVKFNTRGLTQREKAIAREIFGNQINVSRVRVDEFAFGGPRTHHFAYVSFYTINSWGHLNESLFIHELVHVWQYEQLGSVYIPRALSAQFSDEGYDYGGLAKLVKAVKSGKGLKDFNLEQQGDIIADYFRIKQGDHARWSLSDQQDLWVFEQLVAELRQKNEAVAA
jgi:hypothetical protein